MNKYTENYTVNYNCFTCKNYLNPEERDINKCLICTGSFVKDLIAKHYD